MLILHGGDRGIEALPYHDHEPLANVRQRPLMLEVVLYSAGFVGTTGVS